MLKMNVGPQVNDVTSYSSQSHDCIVPKKDTKRICDMLSKIETSVPICIQESEYLIFSYIEANRRKIFAINNTQPIGEGGFGQVYLAQDLLKNDNLLVAKVACEKHKNTLCNEKKILDALNRYKGFASFNKSHYLFSNYCEGKDLTDIIFNRAEGHKNIPLPISRILTLTRAIFEAVNRLHNSQILHRDLKPDNIRICDHPDGMTSAQLIDFGNSHLAIDSSTQFLGSPGYTPPEQSSENLRKNEFYSVQSEYYILGLILAMMLSSNSYPRLIHEHLNKCRNEGFLKDLSDQEIKKYLKDIPPTSPASKKYEDCPCEIRNYLVNLSDLLMKPEPSMRPSRKKFIRICKQLYEKERLQHNDHTSENLILSLNDQLNNLRMSDNGSPSEKKSVDSSTPSEKKSMDPSTPSERKAMDPNAPSEKKSMDPSTSSEKKYNVPVLNFSGFMSQLTFSNQNSSRRSSANGESPSRDFSRNGTSPKQKQSPVKSDQYIQRRRSQSLEPRQ